MTDNVTSFEFHLEGTGAEARLRALRRRFREASQRRVDPFTTFELALLGFAVFMAVFSVGVFGLS